MAIGLRKHEALSVSGAAAKKRSKSKSTIREYAEAIAIALVLALFIRTFVVQAFKIPSGSMIPTLEIGDHILVNKFIYGFRIPYTKVRLLPFTQPKRGDVIVFVYPQDHRKDFIKRVIGVAGDTVEIRDKQIYLNGKPFQDPWGVYSDPRVIPGRMDPRDNFGPVQVPQHALFVMGDNRDNSRDSRYWGFVDLGMVKGKAFLIYYSWNRQDHDIRWGRIGHLIH
jgi:signal peptidase I